MTHQVAGVVRRWWEIIFVVISKGRICVLRWVTVVINDTRITHHGRLTEATRSIQDVTDGTWILA